MRDIGVDQVCFIVAKTREYQTKVEPVGENIDADAAERDVLEDFAGDPTFDEQTEALRDLNADQRAELVALTWIGRSDFTKVDWAEAIEGAQEVVGKRFVRYMTGIPLLADYLEAGFEESDESCEAFETGRMQRGPVPFCVSRMRTKAMAGFRRSRTTD